MPALVTLTTDFGTRDPYVAAMKGVLLRACPGVSVLDLTHEIAPRDVLEGALFLAAAVPYFPPRTVHVAVVDPGVGTARRPIAVAVAGQTVVCPDNGLLTLLAREHAVEEARVISAPGFTLERVSPTFHGRDVFAPAAARLACGASLADAGEPLARTVTLEIATARRDPDGRILGEVIHVDRFGNAISNIGRSTLGGAAVSEVRVRGLRLPAPSSTYGDVAAGEPLALFGSAGYLEIAVNAGSASEQLGLRVGDSVETLVEAITG